MRRLLAKIIITNSVDTGRELPKWVQIMARTDAGIADYYRQAKSLTNRLRDEATAWAEADYQRVNQLTPESKKLVAVDRSIESAFHPPVNSTVLAALTLCASLLACFVWWNGMTSSKGPAVKLGQEVRSSTNVDIRPVLAALSANAEVYHKISLGTQSLFSQSLALTDAFGIEDKLTKTQLAGDSLKEVGRDVGGALSRLAKALALASPPSSRAGEELEQPAGVHP